MIRIIFYISLPLFLISCSTNDKELEKGWWKYGEGYHIGDVLDFKKHKLSNDTIFINDKPRALLIRHENFISKRIVIKSLESDETGTYHNK
ncbi:hypothetical protein [Tenacibaculum ovolyticum]|uniref:hypothetical protein n=1 Tax=Tenacibaculum ovolyticum TaxID=104270 RepID=UPI003BA9B114